VSGFHVVELASLEAILLNNFEEEFVLLRIHQQLDSDQVLLLLGAQGIPDLSSPLFVAPLGARLNVLKLQRHCRCASNFSSERRMAHR